MLGCWLGELDRFLSVIVGVLVVCRGLFAKVEISI